MKGILYYTDSQLEEGLAELVRKHILNSGLPIISVSLEPLDFGKNIRFEGKRGYLTMFKQILVGLKASEADYIFMCEHDVLYHSSHFEFEPKRNDVYHYNKNAWKYKPKTGQVVKYDCHWLSQVCASRKILTEHYEKKIHLIEDEGRRLWNWRFEPGTKRGIDNYGVEWWESEYPNIDIKHGKNLTGAIRFKREEFRDQTTCQNWQETTVDKIPGWKLAAM